jgi:threonine synthase
MKHKCLRQKIIKKLIKKQEKSATQVSVINNKTALELRGSFDKNQDLLERLCLKKNGHHYLVNMMKM